MALQLLLMCVLKLGTHTCARSTGKAGKQARRWLSPVEDVIALPSTQALPLTFKL